MHMHMNRLLRACETRLVAAYAVTTVPELIEGLLWCSHYNLSTLLTRVLTLLRAKPIAEFRAFARADAPPKYQLVLSLVKPNILIQLFAIAAAERQNESS